MANARATVEGFVLVPATRTAAARRRVVARRAATSVLGKGWRLKPITKTATELLATPMRGTRRPGPARAFDLARALAAQPGMASAEPAMRVPGIEPAPPPVPRARRVAARGVRARAPLPCAQGRPRWSIELMRVPEAWRLPLPHGDGRRFGEGIVVAHPDTGYTRHPEIWGSDGARVLVGKGYDFADGDRDARDPLTGMHRGHGTSTASVIMSTEDPTAAGARVTGVAPAATLIPYRVSDSVIHFSFAAVAQAIHSAVDAGAHVVSMSLGGVFASGVLERAIERALDNGVILLAAAGNVWPWVVYPARYSSVIAVAAVNCERRPWSDSASGPQVDLSAPGESVWRARSEADRPGGYSVSPSSGTSYAVAGVAGACALWLAWHGRNRLIRRYGPRGLQAAFRQTLVNHACVRPPKWKSRSWGAGILDVERLLTAPLPPVAPPRARRARAAARAPAPDPLDRVAMYRPDLGRSELRSALRGMLGVATAELAPVLEEFGDEIAFRLATDPALRGRLTAPARQRAARAGPAKKGVRRAPQRAADPQLLRGASSALRRALERS